ncbi:MAG: recombinase family protein [Bacillota bacterium]
MRAAVYIRVSTDDQVKHGYSLAEQREACCSRARILGAQEVTVFSDEGISGSTLERPGLNEMREAAREGRFQLLEVIDGFIMASRDFQVTEVIRGWPWWKSLS